MTDHDSSAPRVAEARTLSLSYWAVISAVLAVGALFAPVLGLRLVVAIIAVVTGHAALHEIKAGLKSGKSFASGGLGIGYLVIVLSVVVAFFGD